MTRERQGWTFVGVMLPITIANVAAMARQRVDATAVWQVWRPMILDLMLVVAGATLVATVAAAVLTWRRGADA